MERLPRDCAVLFNAAADAIARINAQNSGAAAEALYMDAEEEQDVCQRTAWNMN